MEKVITYTKYLVFIVVTVFAIDARYGLRSVQAQNAAAIEQIRMERQEEVLQRRYFDLVRAYGPNPTHEQKIVLDKAECDWERAKAKVNKALGIKEGE